MFIQYRPDVLLIAAAVLPAVALLWLVYRADKVEKEPPRLLLRLILLGILATIIAKALERLGLMALSSLVPPNTLVFDVLLYFGIVAFAEEGSKYFLLKKATWNSPEFNCRFDGVVYATFIALGFALWENIGFVLFYGFDVALLRAVTAVPGHACFGVFMGCWYSSAKVLDREGYDLGSKAARALALIVSALLHGVYDFIASSINSRNAWAFLVFITAMFIGTYLRVIWRAEEDRHI